MTVLLIAFVSAWASLSCEEQHQWHEKPAYIFWDRHDLTDGHGLPSTGHAVAWAAQKLDLNLSRAYTKPVSPLQTGNRICGVAYWIEKGDKSVNWSSFREVRDKAEFLRNQQILIDSYRRQNDVTTAGDDTALAVKFSRTYETTKTNFTTRREGFRTIHVGTPVLDKNGKPVREVKTVNGAFYSRLAGQLSFMSYSPGLITSKRLEVDRPRQFRNDDRTYLLNLADVSKESKEHYWNLIRNITMAAIQRRDGEDESAYRDRHTVGSYKLGEVKRALFDVSQAGLSVNYGSDTAPITLTLFIRPRKKSSLERTFREIQNRRVPRTSLTLGPQPFAEFSSAFCVPAHAKDAIAIVTRQSDQLGLLQETVEKAINDGSFAVQGGVFTEQQMGPTIALAISSRSWTGREMLELVSQLEASHDLVEGARSRILRVSLPDSANQALAAFGMQERQESFAYISAAEGEIRLNIGSKNGWKAIDSDTNDVPPASDLFRLHAAVEPGQTQTLRWLERIERNLLGRAWQDAAAFWKTSLDQPADPKMVTELVFGAEADSQKPAHFDVRATVSGGGLRMVAKIDRRFALWFFGRLALNRIEAAALRQ